MEIKHRQEELVVKKCEGLACELSPEACGLLLDIESIRDSIGVFSVTGIASCTLQMNRYRGPSSSSFLDITADMISSARHIPKQTFL